MKRAAFRAVELDCVLGEALIADPTGSVFGVRFDFDLLESYYVLDVRVGDTGFFDVLGSRVLFALDAFDVADVHGPALRRAVTDAIADELQVRA